MDARSGNGYHRNHLRRRLFASNDTDVALGYKSSSCVLCFSFIQCSILHKVFVTTSLAMLAPLKHLTSALFMSSHFYNTYAMSQPRLYKPADAAKHAGTIMGWPTRQSVFGSGAGWSYPGVDLQETRKEIAGIAKAIAKYEPVQMLVRDPKSVQDPKDPDNLKSAQQLLGSESNVTLVMTDNIDSLWLRDTAPLFVFADNNQMVDNTWPRHADPGIGFKVENTTSNVVGLDLNFNQWGRKLPPSRDSK